MVPSWAEWTLPQDSKSGQRDAGMDFFWGGGGYGGNLFIPVAKPQLDTLVGLVACGTDGHQRSALLLGTHSDRTSQAPSHVGLARGA